MSTEPAFSQRFIAEAREHLVAMNSSMIALERNEGSPQPLVEQLLRAAHSIKGGAGFIGRRNIEQLAHALETAIENIRDGRVERNSDVVDTLLAVLDRITAMVDDVEHSDEVDISGALARLQPITSATMALATLPTTPPARDFDVSDHLLQKWPVDEMFLYGVKLDWAQCERELALTPLMVAERVQRAGRILESQTRLGGAALDAGLPQAPFWYLAIVSSSSSMNAFTDLLDISCATVAQLREKPRPTPTEAPRPRAAPAAASLRVSVLLVDKMMALAGELVLVRNQALRTADANSPMRRLLRRLDAVTNELQDAALRMRTQPVGTLFDRFPRVVRDLARQLKKQIEVHITGSEVELDKTILEMLADPLTHLIRNCCDHGIETPEKRASAGKASTGRIDLSARQERGQMVIEIRDDGHGIDRQAIKRKAIEQGLKRGDELDRMSDRQLYGLILLSGFSTATHVTDLSGRGVGMDVVRTNLEQIGGVVEIDSVFGRGSVFTLRLPLTLAIMPCLLLGNDGQCYGMPQRDVEEIVLLGAAHSTYRIERSHDSEVLRWRGRLLPVARLREVLRRRQSLDAEALSRVAAEYQQAGTPSRHEYGAIIRLGSRRYVLVFDEVLGSENIVVKSLHSLLRPLGIYAAATILGDGSVALVLSAEGIARHGGILEQTIGEAAKALPSLVQHQPEKPVLLFRYGPSELLAVDLSAVRRVVTASSDRIEHIGDREMINVDDAATNVVRLDQFLSLSRPAQENRLFLLLPRSQRQPLGFLASEIVDTPTLPLQLDTRAYGADGVLGSMMIRGEIALFIDLDRIAQLWQAANRSERKALPDAARGRILVVDDTQFFQKLVGEHLRGVGYEVQVADNGKAGQVLLREGGIDLVVCDIEMPVMDGHAFARAVRADPQLAGTPLLALTTLNTPESRAAAAQSGFDAYEVKLDRQSLLATVDGLLQRSRQPQLLKANKNA